MSLQKLLLQQHSKDVMRIITECEDVQGKYVIVRASCNVPVAEGQVVNDFRLKSMLPTLEWLREQEARIIVIAHIGREPDESLKPVHEALLRYLPIEWGGDIFDDEFKVRREAMQDGDVILAENIRQDVRESENDDVMAEYLASLANIYVNEAFDNIHRDHTSMVALPKLLPSYAGINLYTEVTNVAQALTPVPPSLFIIGGAKFETKTPLIEKYLTTYDFVFVGGALAHDILKADGYEVGQSLVSPVSLVGHPMLSNKKLLRPVDVVAVRGDQQISVLIKDVEAGDIILDMGERTVTMLAPYIKNAKTILWNGPLGKYEVGGGGSTEAVAKLISESEAFSVLGGGDTVAAVEALGINDKFGHVSTGGGAMLTYLENGTTPALDVLE